MSTSYTNAEITVTLNKLGADRYTKTSYPIRYGKYSEVVTDDAVYQFNLNGEIVFTRGRNGDWHSPQEWLKRSVGNDWVYYSTGGYTGVYEAIGEFYLPNLSYPTNSLLGGKPFTAEYVIRRINGWYDQLLIIAQRLKNAPPETLKFLEKITQNNPQLLEQKAEHLFQISGGRVTVMPPDCRHVDYDIIPLSVTSGCLYKCRFCKVKNSRPFREKKHEEIDCQIEQFKQLYGNNLANYNSIFLGEHDALCGSRETLLYGIVKSYEGLGFSHSYMRGANYFLFGSVDSLLNTEELFFQELSRLPCEFYINIGLESADQETLDKIGKPITSAMVKDAFRRIQEINEKYLNVEVTSNFIMDETLPENHYISFLGLVRDSLSHKKPKGCVYLSPLKFGSPSRELVFDFNRVKLQSRLPTYLYIIQRL